MSLGMNDEDLKLEGIKNSYKKLVVKGLVLIISAYPVTEMLKQVNLDKPNQNIRLMSGVPLSSSAISYPSNNAQIDINNCYIAWVSSPGAEYYKVALKDLTANQKILNDVMTNATSMTFQGIAGHNYRCAVEVVSKNGEDWTECCFSVKEAPKQMPLSAPVISYPSNNQAIDANQTYIKWDNVPGAESYKVALKDLTTNQKILNDVSTPYTSLSFAGTAGHSYRCAVDAVRGTEENWTERYFNVKQIDKSSVSNTQPIQNSSNTLGNVVNSVKNFVTSIPSKAATTVKTVSTQVKTTVANTIQKPTTSTPSVQVAKLKAPAAITLPTDDGSMLYCKDTQNVTIRWKGVRGARKYEVRAWDITRGDKEPAVNVTLSGYSTSYKMNILGGDSYKIEVDALDKNNAQGEIASSIIEKGKLVTRDMQYGCTGGADVDILNQKLDYIFTGTGIPNLSQYGTSFSKDADGAIKAIQETMRFEAKDGVVDKNVINKINSLVKDFAKMTSAGDTKLKEQRDELKDLWFKISLQNKELKINNVGPEVGYLEKMLQTIELPFGSSSIDNIFGTELEKTIKGIQRGYGYQETGVMDKQTFDAIANLVDIKNNYSKKSRSIRTGYENSLKQINLNRREVDLEYYLKDGNVVKAGTDGKYISIVQEHLQALGLPIGSTTAGGRYGDETLISVKAVQRAQSLKNDGVVGQDTWGAIVWLIGEKNEYNSNKNNGYADKKKSLNYNRECAKNEIELSRVVNIPLQKYSTNTEAVNKLQSCLNQLGLEASSGQPDGSFEDKTELAVAVVQKAALTQGAYERGKVNAATWTTIYDLINQKNSYNILQGKDATGLINDLNNAKSQVLAEMAEEQRRAEDASRKQENLFDAVAPVVSVNDNGDILFIEDQIMWNYIGIDTAKARYGGIADPNGAVKKAESNIGKLQAFTVEQLTFLYLIDPYGVKDYLHFTTPEFRIEVYKELTKKQPRYWEHSFLSGWNEIGKPAGELPNDVISEADVYLDMMPPGDINLNDIVEISAPYIIAGAMLSFAAPEAAMLAEGAAVFGIENAVTAYIYGNLGWALQNENTEIVVMDEIFLRESVVDKLNRYLLNPDHPKGGSKAKWFSEALGFERNNANNLANQIIFDSNKAVETGITEYGTKYNQVISINGANGKTIDVTFCWIKNNDGIVRFVTGIPTKQ